VIFSQQEVRQLLKAPKLLKHRILFATIYDCGLRISEVINLRIEDLDCDRKQVHIRESKHKKDRYVPISSFTIQGLRKYMETTRPNTWLFNGRIRGEQISRAAIRHAIKAAIGKTAIQKDVCVHSLRHSYATHLLEMGLDIVTVKNQLGHVKIETTMMYLHIARSSPNTGFGPMDKLYPDAK